MHGGEKLKRELAFLLTLPLHPGRLGLRQLALAAAASLELRRARVLAEGASRLPLSAVQGMVAPLVGGVPGYAHREVSHRIEVLLRAGHPLPPLPTAFQARHARPWRALVAVVETLEDPSLREVLLRRVFSLDEASAWLGFAYLRLAARWQRSEQALAGIPVLLEALFFMERRRALWAPWNGKEAAPPSSA